ncbi:MAG: ABC transporter ATP-binding protein [Rhodospirillales bacterium]|nr:ABC transporter ATP-binding protein [Rhodospirillales bacterium]
MPSSPASPASPVIRAEGLTKRFGDIVAVDAVDFSVPRGITLGLLGGNGAGKTTTLAMVLGLLLPTSGTVTVFGQNMAGHRERVLPRMNFSSPYVNLPRRLTVRENLTVYALLYGLDNRQARILRISEALDVRPFLNRPTGSLSAGQITRVSLAKALINEPELLLLDEPTASLDPDAADWIRAHLDSYRRTSGATIVLASHNMAEVERLCDQVLIMREGAIVASGAPADLIARYGRETLEDVFLDIARGRRDRGAVPGQ